MPEAHSDQTYQPRLVGRYAVYGKLASGGMATVHFGRLLGPVGFSRTVAIKCLHPQFTKDPEFVAMFLDEARLAARVQHPNVVATVDVVAMEEELFLVMDYIRGESFSRLLRSARKQGLEVPEGLIANVMSGMLHGLHAAHDATDEQGRPLNVVHRDVSPQNVLVGIDGVARVLDFGVAKAAARVQVTRDGQMKGKLSYMSPEQLSGKPVDRRSDIFAAGIVLWEALTGERLFVGDDASQILLKILNAPVPPPSARNPAVRRAVDALVLRALAKDPARRFQSAREFAIAVEETMQLVSPRTVGEWVEQVAGDSLEKRELALAEIESISSVSELTQLTPSEPGFMKTLRTQVRGNPVLSQLAGQTPQRQTLPGLAAPPPRRHSPLFGAQAALAVEAQPHAEDAPTTVYDPTTAVLAPPPLPVELLADDDPTTLYTGPNIEIPTSPGMRMGDETEVENPFRTATPWRRYATWGGSAVVFMGLLYFVFSAAAAFSEPSEPAAKQSPPTKVVETATTKPPPREETPQALDPSQLPKLEATEEAPTEAAGSDETPDEPKPVSEPPRRTPTRSTSSTSSQPVKKEKPPEAPKTSSAATTKKPAAQKPARADCNPPWMVDSTGIRRIKTSCL